MSDSLGQSCREELINRKRKIVLHYCEEFLPNSENWIFSQLDSLQRFLPHVVTLHRSNQDAFPFPAERLTVASKAINRLGLLAAPRASLARRRLVQTWRQRPALLHSHFGHRGWQNLWLAQRLKIPHVISFYGQDLSELPRKPIWQDRYQQLFELGTAFVVEGPHMRRSLVGIGCAEDKVHIRRHGVDLALYPFIPRSVAAEDEIRILVAGRFTDKKGIPDAMDALAIASRRFPQIRVSLIGDARNEDPEQAAQKKIILERLEKFPFKQRIVWLGAVSLDRLLEISREHHLFIQASRQAESGDNEGGAPVILTQLAAMGMPIVATRHCDIPEVVIDGKTGTLVPERDPELLAAAIESMIERQEHWPKMGRAAREHVETVFEQAKCVQRLEAIYDAALAGFQARQ